MASVSVILPVRNGAGVLATQLQALAAQRTRHDVELIVADHASTDRTREVASGFVDRFERLVVHPTDHATGVAGVRNAAAAIADGDFLAFCDSDDMAHPDWLEQLVEPLLGERCHTAGRLIYVGGDQPLDDGAFARRPSVRHPYMSHQSFADTCSMGVRRDDLHRVGLFDEMRNEARTIGTALRVDARRALRGNRPERTPLALARATGRLAGSCRWRTWYP